MDKSEQRRAYARAYRAKHHDRLKAQQKVYYESHKPEFIKRANTWMKGHRPWASRYNRDRKRAQRDQVLAHYGARCAGCSYDADERALVIDHVNDDGAADRKKHKTRSAKGKK